MRGRPVDSWLLYLVEDKVLIPWRGISTHKSARKKSLNRIIQVKRSEKSCETTLVAASEQVSRLKVKALHGD